MMGQATLMYLSFLLRNKSQSLQNYEVVYDLLYYILYTSWLEYNTQYRVAITWSPWSLAEVYVKTFPHAHLHVQKTPYLKFFTHVTQPEPLLCLPLLLLGQHRNKNDHFITCTNVMLIG